MKHYKQSSKSKKIVICLLFFVCLLAVGIFAYIKFFCQNFDVDRNKKEIGQHVVAEGDNNIVVSFSSDYKILDEGCEKVKNNLEEEAKKGDYKSYLVDYRSKKVLPEIIEVEYLLYDNKWGREKPKRAKTVYYSEKANELLTSQTLLRHNYANIIRLEFPKLDFKDADLENMKITKDKVSFGKVNLPFDKYKKLFKANLGVPSLYKGEKIVQKETNWDDSKKHIAFTFDDGPLNENHDKIRELFNKYNQRATFFFVGSAMEKHSDKVVETYKAGHQVSSHSWSHPLLTSLDEKDLVHQILDTDDLILTLTGRDNDYLRPPYGAFNDKVKSVTNDRIALWNIDSLDWKTRNKDAIINHVMPLCDDGDVVLFHDIYSATYEAMEVMIPKLIAQGYQFVTMDELLQHKNAK